MVNFNKLLKPISHNILYIILVCFGISLLLFTCSQSALQKLITWQLKLDSPDKTSYQQWSKPDVPIYMSLYFFNITNSEFALKQEKIHVEEVGPYVFLEKRWKEEIVIDHENHTISYVDRKSWIFDQNQSIGSLSDQIHHVNVPLVSLIDYVHIQNEYYLRDFLEVVSANENVTMFMNHTVSELTFEGYNDILLDQALSMGANAPDKFGLFYGRNATATSRFVLDNGALNINHFGFIREFNGSSELSHWKENSTCNVFQNSSTGELYPPFQPRPPHKITIFVSDVCRTLDLNLAGTQTYGTLQTNRYVLNPDSFDYDLPENTCYCIAKEGCPKNGVFLNAPCAQGAPSAISYPRFKYADKSYLKAISGIKDDEEEFYIDIEPTLGVVVKASAKLQVNFRLRKSSNSTQTDFMTKNELYIPFFWFQTEAIIPNDLQWQLGIVNCMFSLFSFIVPVCFLAFGLFLVPIYIWIKVRSPKEVYLTSEPKIARTEYTKVQTTSFNS